ncbi:MAG: Hdr-like menaquinol oxidoreductase cytochrome c subunit [Gammaproteobacteria bacterium]|nr:Hdr-like menaquinol oxidoreductase cytochrome c subunit [Gammaproteobacteria bacterium]
MFLMVVGFTVTISATDLKPQVSKGKGEACVDDKDFMRLNHMDLLRHERDETLHEGIRDTKYSLKKCITCHAVDGSDGATLTIESPKHFCRSCHDYAAVSIDCFQCHTSKPDFKKNNSLRKIPEEADITKGKEE